MPQTVGEVDDAEMASVDAAEAAGKDKAMARRRRRRSRWRRSGSGVIGWRWRRSAPPTSARRGWRGVETGEGREVCGDERD
jgi:hypothetical protein